MTISTKVKKSSVYVCVQIQNKAFMYAYKFKTLLCHPPLFVGKVVCNTQTILVKGGCRVHCTVGSQTVFTE